MASSTHPCKNGSFCSFMLCSREPANWSAALGLYPCPELVAFAVFHSASIPRTDVIGERRPQEDVFEDARGRKSGLNWNPPLINRSQDQYCVETGNDLDLIWFRKIWSVCVCKTIENDTLYFPKYRDMDSLKNGHQFWKSVKIQSFSIYLYLFNFKSNNHSQLAIIN